jgi:hypothetical protein
MNPKEKKDWNPEPFPEPRTIPEGWNASAFSDEKTASQQDDPGAEWKPDPFPEPRMFPWRSGG